MPVIADGGLPGLLVALLGSGSDLTDAHCKRVTTLTTETVSEAIHVLVGMFVIDFMLLRPSSRSSSLPQASSTSFGRHVMAVVVTLVVSPSLQRYDSQNTLNRQFL